MKAVLGYADKLTVRPGEDIAFRVSCTGPGVFDAQLVRLLNGDLHSETPRFREIEVAATVNGSWPARCQPIHPGSCAIVPGTAFEAGCPAITLVPVHQRAGPFRFFDAVSGRQTYLP